MFDKLDFITEKYDELAQTVSDPAVIANQPVWQKHVKEMGEMEPIVKKYKEYRDTKAGIADAKEMLEDGDEEMRELAKMELTELEEKIPELEAALTAENWAVLDTLAHAVKGNALATGDTDSANAAIALRIAAKMSNKDEANSHFEELKKFAAEI